MKKEKKLITDYSSAMNYCVWLLSRSDSTSKLLSEKLKFKECPENIINDVIKNLSERGYINDYDYALKFLTDKQNLKKKGRKYIEFELKRRGIDAETIENLLNEYYTCRIDEAARLLLQKYDTPLCELDKKELNSFIMRLQRQGYSWDEIKEYLGRMNTVE